MGQALYRKWRPSTFDDLVGQEHIVRTLRNALRLGHVHHAYLFAGPRGTGKTTSARLLAKAVNCLAPVEERPCNQCVICQAVNEGRLMDLIEIDAASNTGVDNVREILDKVGFRPVQARQKVYVIDEVHMLSTAAFNALLKTLEEPPPHVLFILATTEVHKIPATILSRCQRFEFRRIPLGAMTARLVQVTRAEGIEADPEALDLIARAATGSLRDALSLLDQMAADGSVTVDTVRQMLGAERRDVIQSLVRCWLEHDFHGGLELINRAINGGADPRQIARQLSDFLRGLLLMRLGAGESWTDPSAEERPGLQELARNIDPARLVEAVRRFSQVAADSRAGWQPQLPLELAFVEVTLEPPQAAPAVQPAASAAPVTPPARPATAPARSTPPVATQPPATPSLPSATAATARPTTPAAASTPAATTPAPAAGGGAGGQLKPIADAWAEVVNLVKPLNMMLSALLRDCRPVYLDVQGQLTLTAKSSFHSNKVNEEANRQILEGVLRQKFGQAFQVRCVPEKEWRGSTGSTPAPAPVSSAPASPSAPVSTPAQPSKPVDDPLQDEVVRRAMDELGAVPKIPNE